MTMLAGIYSRNRGDIIPDAVCNGIRRSLSRHPKEEIDQFRDDRCFMVKVDIGAYGEPALQIDAAGASFGAAEPLLPRADSLPVSRSRDVSELHDAFSHGDLSLLEKARGI